MVGVLAVQTSFAELIRHLLPSRVTLVASLPSLASKVGATLAEIFMDQEVRETDRTSEFKVLGWYRGSMAKRRSVFGLEISKGDVCGFAHGLEL